MSPAKFYDDHEQAARKDVQMINGPRPSPLRINRDSLVIHKPYVNNHHHQQQQQNPVIIYTHSPKIIHTQARDFMALVQKLTGPTRSQNESSAPSQPQKGEDNRKPVVRQDENKSSSATREENCGDRDGDGAGAGAGDDHKERASYVSPMFNAHKTYLADIPLFTPSWNDFFCSPRPRFRYNDMVSPSRNMVKGLPEY
ncbi:VQ motif-containing protein 8, chloroplastic-like [Cornus florida]|uniref:VQ motif-containing protein 8, chloroplastic-like n=1 Tax=Cornus florida TaxID=4283 RepID=UPI0028982F87|nr:VQ motif-containing protein 8, chloroplastic-like [Cornus florida]